MSLRHYLLTTATLQEFLSDINDVCPGADQDALIEAWQAAHAAMDRMVEREAGCADLAAVLPLPEVMQPQVAVVSRSPEVNQAHRLVPVAFGLVESDALMTTRRTLSEAKLESVRSTVISPPDDVALGRICLALSTSWGGVNYTRWDGQGVLITTDIDDLRLLNCEVLHGASVPASVSPGLTQIALHCAFGSSLPVMHAVQLNGRVLLVKGHHRARVLRAMGVKHLPCLISACTELSDIFSAAPGLDRAAVERCFAASRPTMLRDFDRAALTYSHQASKRRRLLQVRVEVSSRWLPTSV